jgi:hypothetical protein
MQRVLVVLRGPIEVEAVRRRCALEIAEPFELAVCHVLPEGRDGFNEGLRAQQEITAALRLVLGRRAETVAVFVASERHGYRVDDCMKDWGATLVYA